MCMATVLYFAWREKLYEDLQVLYENLLVLHEIYYKPIRLLQVWSKQIYEHY